MTRIKQTKRTVIAFWAWMGWVAAGSITLGAPFTDLAQTHPFFVHRLFALAALAATVLSVAWLIERARRPAIPVSTETGFNLGVEVGKDIGRMEALDWSGPCAHSPMGDQIMNGRSRNTPPFGRS